MVIENLPILQINKLTQEQYENAFNAGNIKNNTFYLTPDKPIFQNKTAAFYGDSITEENLHYIKGYHKWVQEILGLSYYKNRGVSGYTIAQVRDEIVAINENVDIIFVMCGVNDPTNPLGSLGDTASSGTTYGDIDSLCSTLKTKYPTKIIVVITPAYQNKYTNTSGSTCYEVSKAFKEVCEKYAITVFDNNVFSSIYYTNLDKFTTDNCHWNDLAHKMVGKNLAQFMLSTFSYIIPNESQHFDVTINGWDFGTATLIDFIIENPGIKEGLSCTLSFNYDNIGTLVPETSTTDGPFGTDDLNTTLTATTAYCDSDIVPVVSGTKVTLSGIIGTFMGDTSILDSKYLHICASFNGASTILPYTTRLTNCVFTISGLPQKIVKVSSYKGNATGIEI